MSVADNAIRATMAYQGAVEDYGNFIDSTMRQYGWTMPDASGQYSVQGAQDAFDPNRVIQFDESGKPTFDAERIASMTSGGQYGTTGTFAETAQAGAASEATARAEARMRGFGRGSGLSRQAEVESEDATRRAMGEVSAGLFGDVFAKYGGLGRLYQDVAVGEATDAAIRASQNVENISVGGVPPMPDMTSPAANYTAPPAEESRIFPTGKDAMGEVLPSGSRGNYTIPGSPKGKNVPKGKDLVPGRTYRGAGGVDWVYRSSGPKGKGWYKKAKR
jgi:hypothetical protein